MKNEWKIDPLTGEVNDKARVEISIVGNPRWSPLMRFRFYMDHKPDDHLTVWWCRWLTPILGYYTPPAWFLRLIGQTKE